MKIGIINIEPKIFNTAYMQIARFHRDRGDEVDWWRPITDSQFDHVYCSSLFDYTDKSEVTKRAICGGTGFDVSSLLSVSIERSELDYSIYPSCSTSYLWFSRGCIRNCPWCVVPQKEGYIKPVLPKNLNPKGKYVTVCDNNFFADPLWKTAVRHLHRIGQPCDFQGIDIRIITDEQCKALSKLRHHKQIRFAWDDPRDEEKVLAGIKRITKYIKAWRCMCYVLIGFYSIVDGRYIINRKGLDVQGSVKDYNKAEELDLHRVNTLRGLGIDPFVMPYDRSDLYQKAFARWVNRKEIFNKVPWEDYKYRVQTQEAKGTGWKI